MIARSWARIVIVIHSAWAAETVDYLQPMVEILSSDGTTGPLDGIALGLDTTGPSVYFVNYAQTTDQGDFIAAFGGGDATALYDTPLAVEIECTLNDDLTITSSYRIADDANPDDASTWSGSALFFSQDPSMPTDIDGFGVPLLIGSDGLLDITVAEYGTDNWIGAGGATDFSFDYSGSSPYVPPFTGQYDDSVGDFVIGLGTHFFPPVITAFFPEEGTDGTQVTIDGRNFIGVTKVEFNTNAEALFTDEGPPFYDAAYAHNAAFATAGPYQTALTGPEEAEFRAWVVYQQIPFDPDADTVDYDMRGYWKGQAGHSGTLPAHGDGDHFPDTWKTPYDTTFSAESMYATGDCPFHWVDDALVDSRDNSLVFGVLPKDALSFDVKSATLILAVAPEFVSTGRLHVTGPGGTSP